MVWLAADWPTEGDTTNILVVDPSFLGAAKEANPSNILVVDPGV